MPDEPKDDGIDREKFDYRVGYCEGLGALLARLRVEAIRAKPREAEGMERAFNLATALRQDMLAKIREATAKLKEGE